MPGRPNILFLFSDEHSFRFLSSRSPERGGEPCHTPTLDKLIQQGVHFDAAYCQMPLCVPSRVSMLTGQHSHRRAFIWPGTPTFASQLSQDGYASAAVGKMHLIGSCQYVGFGARPYGDFGLHPPGHQRDPLSLTGLADHCFMPSIMRDVGVSDLPESMLQEHFVVRESIAWLREQQAAHPDQPWLLLASFCRPHFPVLAPRRFFHRYYPKGVTPPRVGRTGDSQNHPMTLGAIRAKRGELQGYPGDEITEEEMMRYRAGYSACVDQLDEILGDFLTILERDGLLDNTVIVYTSDHGELAGEHGLFFKNTWHEASCRVPLIISLPEHRRGDLPPSEVKLPVSLGDIFPTLCGLTGAPQPDDVDGIDLSPAIRGQACPALEERPGIIVEHLNTFAGEGTEYRMIRSPHYKYVTFRACDDLAFDLMADPDEQRNLVGRAQGEVAQELARLEAALLAGFDFDEAADFLEQERRRFLERHPVHVKLGTSNQILRHDGVLIEADQPLYHPDVVSSDLRKDFDDFPM